MTIDKSNLIYGGYTELFDSLHTRQCRIPTDVTLEIGASKKLFQCHRLIVSLHSSVLKEMLYGKRNEEKEGLDFCIEKEGYTGLSFQELACGAEKEGETFQQVLKFLYTGKLDLNDENVVKITELLKFLKVEVLYSDCLAHITKMLKVENVCYLWEFSKRYEMEEITTKCSQMITTNITKVFETKTFLQISEKSVTEILQMNVNVREHFMFDGLVKWAKFRAENDTKKDLKGHMSKHLQYIRFPIMTPSEIAQFVVPLRVVSESVIVEAYTFQSKLEHTEEKDVRFQYRSGAGAGESIDKASTLMKSAYQMFIRQYIGPRKWSLIYKASRDGFNMSTFLQTIQSKGPYFMIFKVNGNEGLFGGYTSTTYQGSNECPPDMSAFLVQFIAPQGEQTMKLFWRKAYNNNGFYWHTSYGIRFAGDIYWGSHSSAFTSNPNCYIDNENTFSNTTFAGSASFQVDDFEVFQVSRCD